VETVHYQYHKHYRYHHHRLRRCRHQVIIIVFIVNLSVNYIENNEKILSEPDLLKDDGKRSQRPDFHASGKLKKLCLRTHL
jgi:hypothetical protein